ncbi:hypothetical protein [Phytohabitans flavus]|uniref:hypothetical protein n=1 Tax=Phytohabitans flavus TaxID=1076124 RepID=UPI002F969263
MATTVEARTKVRQARVTLPTAWLVLLGLANALCLVAVWRFFVRSERGQLLDTVALEGNAIGQDRVDGLANTVLNAVSLASLAVATIVVAVIALARGGYCSRWWSPRSWLPPTWSPRCSSRGSTDPTSA